MPFNKIMKMNGLPIEEIRIVGLPIKKSEIDGQSVNECPNFLYQPVKSGKEVTK